MPKRDELLLFTHGEHSDYDVLALAKVRKDFSVAEVLTAYFAARPTETAKYSCKFSTLLSWLQIQGFIDEVPHQEIHLGDLCTIDPDLLQDRA